MKNAEGNPAWFACCPPLESSGAATSGRTKEEALRNVNEVVRMIVQEFIEEGKPLPSLFQPRPVMAGATG